MKKTKKLIFAALFITISLFGCSGGDAINEENLAKIEEGMTIAEVKEILGEPTQVLTTAGPETGHYIWLSSDRKHGINIGFKNGRVGIKQWIESKKAKD